MIGGLNYINTFIASMENFMKPTRLYIKKCSHCQKMYFGKSITKDLLNYSGSGKLWKLHLNKHNAKAIHIWNSDWYYSEKSIKEDALKFSIENDIIKNENWFNLKEENGLDGGDTSAFVDKTKLSESLKGNKNPAKQLHVRQKISKSLTGKKASEEATLKNRNFRKGKTKENYEPIKRMADTMSKIMTGLTKENSEMRRNHSKSLSKSMTGLTKETCPRLAAAAKTLSESMRKIKHDDRLKIIKWVDNDKLTWKEIQINLSHLNASLRQIRDAYKHEKKLIEESEVLQ